METLSKVPDPLARSTYIKECSRILSIEENILVNETNKKIKGEIRQRRFREEMAANRQTDMTIEDDIERQKSQESQKHLFSTTSDQYLEKELIRIIINHADKIYEANSTTLVIDYLIDQCGELIPYFENEMFARLFAEVVHHRKSGGTIDRKHFLNHSDEEIQSLAVDLMSAPYEYANWSDKGMELQTQNVPDENFINESNQISIRLNYRKLEKIISENLEKLKTLSMDSEDYLITLKVHQKLLEDKKRFANLLNNVIS